MAQAIGWLSRGLDSACASHQAVDVLPLVPVTASTSSCADGWLKNAAAMPALAFLRLA